MQHFKYTLHVKYQYRLVRACSVDRIPIRGELELDNRPSVAAHHRHILALT